MKFYKQVESGLIFFFQGFLAIILVILLHTLHENFSGLCLPLYFVMGWWLLIISGGAGSCQIKDMLPADLTSRPQVMIGVSIAGSAIKSFLKASILVSGCKVPSGFFPLKQ